MRRLPQGVWGADGLMPQCGGGLGFFSNRGGYVKFEIMGSLRIGDEQGSYAVLTARKMEILLATLLIKAEEVVSIDQLIEEIWGSNPPRCAGAALHVYVSQLRKFLKRPGRDDSPIVTRAPGYTFRLGPDELDLHEFQRLLGHGRALARAGQFEEAVTSLEGALALWRGPVLGDLRDGPMINGFACWLGEIRLECVELLVSSNLMLDRHEELIGWLYSLIAEHPLHEKFYQQLMLALYRSSRRADALKVYQTAREQLMTELGLEPCGPLRELQKCILAADDAEIDHHAARRGWRVPVVRD
jgi:DNA-binding SARP family transcriptional activator